MSERGKHLQALNRRLAFLERRIAGKDDSQAAMNYLRAEKNALEWALNLLNLLVASGRLKDEGH